MQNVRAPLLALILLGLSALVACDDEIHLPQNTPPVVTDDSGADDTGPPATGYCALTALIASQCVFCHNPAGGPAGGLDLETDPIAAMVGVPSSLYDGRTLVVAGDSGASFLMTKLRGEQSATEGDPMPPQGANDTSVTDKIAAWIDDGAVKDCDDVVPTDYHPAGYDKPKVHGMEAKLHEQTCTDCHGADLAGSSVAPSCDTCHEDGWRTDCTFCHGGIDNTTGAPPEDIDDNSDESSLAFRAHTRHVETNTHTAFDCTSCHVKPTDVLSAGHLFDATPAISEVSFLDGLSDKGKYAGNGSCSTLYCHGNGQGDNGSVTHTAAPLACDACHPGASSGRDAWGTMSGAHEDHLREGITCQDCHSDTTTNGTTVATPAKHVNGVADFVPPYGASLTRNSGTGTCTGTCHTETHSAERWD